MDFKSVGILPGSEMHRLIIQASMNDPKVQALIRGPVEDPPTLVRLLLYTRASDEGATHHVVCPHCGKEIGCDGSEDAPRAYQWHRWNECPEPLEGGKDDAD